MKITKIQLTTLSSFSSDDDKVENTDEPNKEQIILDKLYENPEFLLKIKEPTEEQKQIALTELPKLVLQLHSPSEEDYLIATRSNGMILGGIPKLDRSKKVVLSALSQNGNAIRYLDNPTREQVTTAIRKDAFCIKYILEKLEPSDIELALRKDGLSIQFIENPSEVQQLLAVKQNPIAISVIKNPTSKVKEFAIEQDGLCIEHIKDPSEQLQLLAISSSDLGYAYLYINNPTVQVDIAAYTKNKKLFTALKNMPEEVQLDAVTSDIENFNHIKEPTKKVQKYALKFISSNPHIFDDVSNIDKDVLKEFLEEIKFKEKYDKRLQIPEGLCLEQLKVYKFFQQQAKKEILKDDLRGQPWVDNRILKIVKSVPGFKLKLSDVVEYKVPKPESELGQFIKRNFGLAKIIDDKGQSLLDLPSTYFTVYVDAIRLLDLDFNKDHIYTMSKSLADRQQPYIPNQYILGYIKYSCLKQNVWITELWTDTNLKADDEDLSWVPEWVISLFIREMRYRDYDKFYALDATLRKRFYPTNDSNGVDEQLLEKAYFKKVVLRGFHPKVNGKDIWCLQ